MEKIFIIPTLIEVIGIIIVAIGIGIEISKGANPIGISHEDLFQVRENVKRFLIPYPYSCTGNSHGVKIGFVLITAGSLIIAAGALVYSKILYSGG